MNDARTGYGGACTARDADDRGPHEPRQLAMAADRIEAELERLDDASARLRDRCHPVLRLEPPSAIAAGGPTHRTDEYGDMAPAAARLNAMADRLSRLIFDLFQLADRVEA